MFKEGGACSGRFVLWHWLQELLDIFVAVESFLLGNAIEPPADSASVLHI